MMSSTADQKKLEKQKNRTGVLKKKSLGISFLYDQASDECFVILQGSLSPKSKEALTGFKEALVGFVTVLNQPLDKRIDKKIDKKNLEEVLITLSGQAFSRKHLNPRSALYCNGTAFLDQLPSAVVSAKPGLKDMAVILSHKSVILDELERFLESETVGLTDGAKGWSLSLDGNPAYKLEALPWGGYRFVLTCPINAACAVSKKAYPHRGEVSLSVDIGLGNEDHVLLKSCSFSLSFTPPSDLKPGHPKPSVVPLKNGIKNGIETQASFVPPKEPDDKSETPLSLNVKQDAFFRQCNALAEVCATGSDFTASLNREGFAVFKLSAKVDQEGQLYAYSQSGFFLQPLKKKNKDKAAKTNSVKMTDILPGMQKCIVEALGKLNSETPPLDDLNRHYLLQDVPRDGSPQFLKQGQVAFETFSKISEASEVVCLKQNEDFPTDLEQGKVYLKPTGVVTGEGLAVAVRFLDEKGAVSAFKAYCSQVCFEHSERQKLLRQVGCYHDFNHFTAPVSADGLRSQTKQILSTLIHQMVLQSTLTGFLAERGLLFANRNRGRYTINVCESKRPGIVRSYSITYDDYVKSSKVVTSSEKGGLVSIHVTINECDNGQFQLADLGFHLLKKLKNDPDDPLAHRVYSKMPELSVSEAIKFPTEELVSRCLQALRSDQSDQSDQKVCFNNRAYLKALFQPSFFSRFFKRSAKSPGPVLNAEQLQSLVSAAPETMNFLLKPKPWYAFWRPDYRQMLSAVEKVEKVEKKAKEEPRQGMDLTKLISKPPVKQPDQTDHPDLVDLSKRGLSFHASHEFLHQQPKQHTHVVEEAVRDLAPSLCYQPKLD